MPRTRKATLGALGAAALCATALVGTAGAAPAQDDNGVADQSAADIAAQARDAFAGARSMHLTMETQGSGLESDDPTRLDLSADRSENCVGTVDYAAGGGSLELIRHGNDVWVKPDAAWLETNLPSGRSEDVQRLAGNYLQGTVQDRGLGDIAELCGIDELDDAVEDATTADNLQKGAETTVNGTPVIEVTGQHDGADVTVSVATRGTPYPVQATSRGDGEETTANFAFDQPVPNRTPAPGDTVPWGG
ncbi:hypothetical protein [Streptomyces sp. MAR4 CNX-425]|uniref:hypothetical protein n=1 Tax=Streptomyces sp. MAR4 CNX-425 TaxID=3406343 RepID=UPI003B50EA41